MFFERDLLLAPFAARPAQPRVELHTAGLINLIQRTTLDLQLAVKKFEARIFARGIPR